MIMGMIPRGWGVFNVLGAFGTYHPEYHAEDEECYKEYAHDFIIH
jgi:hypothetical protein